MSENILVNPPVSFPVVSNDGMVQKGWLDWFLKIGSIFSGQYLRDTGYYCDGNVLYLNARVSSAETSYSLPVSVDDGVVTINYLSGDNSSINTSENVILSGEELTLPDNPSGGDYWINGTLLRG